jgi:hypothetical protein
MTGGSMKYTRSPGNASFRLSQRFLMAHFVGEYRLSGLDCDAEIF